MRKIERDRRRRKEEEKINKKIKNNNNGTRAANDAGGEVCKQKEAADKGCAGKPRRARARRRARNPT
jgi:hypothetical protein